MTKNYGTNLVQILYEEKQCTGLVSGVFINFIACRAGIFYEMNACLTIALAAILKASRKWTHRPLPWNHFLPHPNPLSVSLFKMGAYRIIHRSPALQAINFITYNYQNPSVCQLFMQTVPVIT